MQKIQDLLYNGSTLIELGDMTLRGDIMSIIEALQLKMNLPELKTRNTELETGPNDPTSNISGLVHSLRTRETGRTPLANDISENVNIPQSIIGHETELFSGFLQHSTAFYQQEEFSSIGKPQQLGVSGFPAVSTAFHENTKRQSILKSNQNRESSTEKWKNAPSKIRKRKAELMP